LKQGLIIFVRNPDRGKIKTRIANILGDEVALSVYKTLLNKTHFITQDLQVEKFVFYADYINDNDLWEEKSFKKALQHGDDLGERMQNAFKVLFDKGFEQVIVIGSDCNDLTSAILNNAFEQFSKADIIIGPANDGGYYLLGMNTYLPELFDNKKWSTASVYQDTYNQVQSLKLNTFILPALSDVDEVDDINF
jgi:hypothetical protein